MLRRIAHKMVRYAHLDGAVMPTVSSRIVEALAPHVDDVFGLMGNGNAYFLDALLEAGMNYTAVRHEAGAVAAADAYYRASGRIAAVSVTYGAGFTNTLTPIAEAVQARTPLLVVVGDAPTTGPRAWDVDQVALAAAVGAPTYTVGSVGVAATTLQALQRALDDQRPVVLALPYDLAAVDPEDEPAFAALERPAKVQPRRFEISAAVDALAAARRPLILAGRGAWEADSAAVLAELADALGAVTATTALARGIFPKAQFDLGVTGGFGQELAMELIQEADVALVVGARLNQFTMRFGELFAPTTQVIQIDLEEPTNPRVNVFVRGDARIAAEAMVAELAERGVGATGWRESIAALGDGSLTALDSGSGVCADGRLDPRSVAGRLAEILPRDRIVVSDGGHFIGWANSYWPVDAPDRMMMVGTAYQTVGLGIPSAVGAGVARPDSTIVLTAGDGGSLMALADLDSVMRIVRRGVIVIWNDAAYGAELHLYGLRGLNEEPMLIDEVDFAAFARAAGGRGEIVRTISDLDLLEEWLAHGEEGVFLVDCRISRSVMAPYQYEVVAAARK